LLSVFLLIFGFLAADTLQCGRDLNASVILLRNITCPGFSRYVFLADLILQ